MKFSAAPQIRKLERLQVLAGSSYQKNSILARLIHAFKYEHQASAVRYLSPLMVEAFRRLGEPHAAVLVPVPLHPKKERERGYNQAYLLARDLSTALGIPICRALKRTQYQDSQASQSGRAQRLKNLEGAFALALAPPHDRTLILVDDVVTTGSTLLECQKVLQEAGYTRVEALVLANRPLQSAKMSSSV